MMARKAPPLVHPDRMPSALLDQNQQDYSTQVSKALGLQQRTPGHLDARIQLGINIDDLSRPEFLWLRRGGLGYASLDFAVVAGQIPFLALTAPPGVVAVIERLEITNPNAALNKYLIGMQSGLPAAGSTVTGVARDDRMANGGRTAVTLTQGTSAAPASPLIPLTVYVPPNGTATYVLEEPWVITGALRFVVVGFTANQALNASVFWRERFALPSEA